MTSPAATRERLPGQGWAPARVPLPPAESVSAWTDGRVLVISALEVAESPDGRGDAIPQWHISVSERGKRPSKGGLRRALGAFGMRGSEEDNHHPGVARHFWLPVDPTRRVKCQCKADEDVIREPGGYEWTNPKDGACRGCELQRMTGKTCPLHSAVAGAR